MHGDTSHVLAYLVTVWLLVLVAWSVHCCSVVVVVEAWESCWIESTNRSHGGDRECI